MAFGDYPAAYNPTVHGPYDPARFYGKRKSIRKPGVFAVAEQWFERSEKGKSLGFTSRIT